jgi:hypothetical protein
MIMLVLAVLFAAVLAGSANAAPHVTIANPLPGSYTNNQTPAVSGTTNDLLDPVTVLLYAGPSASGSPVRSATTGFPLASESWEVTLAPPLEPSEYTAVAEQTSVPEVGKSEEVHFTVVTAPPDVSITPLTSPTGNSTPTLEGGAGTRAVDNTSLSVTIYQGETVGGAVAASGEAGVKAGGGWSFTSPHLADGTYTAQATQGDKAGNSKSVSTTFAILTAAPTVTLGQPLTPSKNTTPSFGGSATDSTTVTVNVYAGGQAQGTVLASAAATPGAGGAWSSGGVSPALPEGTYTAQASQPSSVAGNPTGKSEEVHFTVVTAPPTVTLKQPASPSKQTHPSFSGSASDSTPVTVHIFNALHVEVAKATANPSGGNWSSDEASPALTDGTYTAQATQESSLGNQPGKSEEVTFTIVTTPPTVTLNQPASPSNHAQPSFSGSASDVTKVTVNVYAGGKAEGPVVASAAATPGAGGEWSSGGVSPALPEGSYTAQASQPSSLGNPPGKSEPVIFTVITAAPTVTLKGPESPSNDTKPLFTGTASESTTVTVEIYAGSKVQGSPVSSASATPAGTNWSSSEASPALSEGTYTAEASQPSSLGNPAGESEAVTFTVITASPTVRLDRPESPSGNTTPSFTGRASDTGTVTVKIYQGERSEGTPVSLAAATGTGGAWTSGHASPALPSGTYTAIASQPSSVGNPEGVSPAVTFTVDTSSPTVTLDQPESTSNRTQPTFSGSASAATTVTVHIYDSSQSEVASATAVPSDGKWNSSKAGPALKDGTYSAVATEVSPLNNPDGVSNSVSFTVNTQPPVVTLNPPALRSNNTAPSFSGTASDSKPVTVWIYAGSKPEGTPVSTATATTIGSGGQWSSAPAIPALISGTYTAVAIQESSIGNPDGRSSPATFVVDTFSPNVALAQPTSPSNVTTPTFTGTASDTTPVTVDIYAGFKAEGALVSSATATSIRGGGEWTSAAAAPALATGEHTYTAVAIQESSLHNPAGRSAPVTFTVNTNPPTVTLVAPKSPSNTTTPTFTGTASDTTSVTVNIYNGSKVEGAPIATATASKIESGGQWSAAPSTPALTSGIYTAVAVEPSSIGNSPGSSPPVTFVVDTSSPKVTLDQPKSPSKNITPSFTGTASDSTEVVVHIKDSHGLEVSSATASGNGGPWTSTAATPALASGESTYTAVATQASSLGNPAGESAPVTFTVNTNPPTVTLVAPKSPSNNSTPSFTGTASDSTPVTVRIYSGPKAEGNLATTAIATTIGAGGQWSSGAPSHALADGEYTAIAVQQSSLGNAAGLSAPVRFTVDTTPPAVHIATPPNGASLSSSRPTFSGSAGSAPGDVASVSLRIYAGTSASGTSAQTLTIVPSGGRWTTGSTEGPQLPNGTYTALAEQSDSAGNTGTSSTTFTVLTNSPTVTLNASAFARRGGNLFTNASPRFSGSAAIAPEDSKTVTVKVYSGTSTSGGPVRTVETSLAGSSWSAGLLPALSEGTYTVQAEQKSFSLGGQPGVSPSSTFTVDATSPQVTVSSPLSGSSTGSESPVVEGSAGTDEGDSAEVSVQVYSGLTITSGQTPTQSHTVMAARGIWSAPLAGLHPGSYTLRAEQSDDVGNQGVSPTTSFTVTRPPAAAPLDLRTPPAASFSSFPSSPHPGERVSLASSSTDATSPITAFAWDLTGSGAFVPGAQSITTSFARPGDHLVRLRVTDAGGLSSVADETIAVTARPLIVMQPFPIVRIAGSATGSGVKLRLLSVQAPGRARITVQCRGRGCPVKSQSRVATVGKVGTTPIEFPRFEHSLPAGVTLEIRVFKPGEVGKYTSFAIRRGKPPKRHDSCLDPGGVKPIPCPSS